MSFFVFFFFSLLALICFALGAILNCVQGYAWISTQEILLAALGRPSGAPLNPGLPHSRQDLYQTYYLSSPSRMHILHGKGFKFYPQLYMIHLSAARYRPGSLWALPEILWWVPTPLKWNICIICSYNGTIGYRVLNVSKNIALGSLNTTCGIIQIISD